MKGRQPDISLEFLEIIEKEKTKGNVANITTVNTLLVYPKQAISKYGLFFRRSNKHIVQLPATWLLLTFIGADISVDLSSRGLHRFLFATASCRESAAALVKVCLSTPASSTLRSSLFLAYCFLFSIVILISFL
jgi:hypothetical protein